MSMEHWRDTHESESNQLRESIRTLVHGSQSEAQHKDALKILLTSVAQAETALSHFAAALKYSDHLRLIHSAQELLYSQTENLVQHEMKHLHAYLEAGGEIGGCSFEFSLFVSHSEGGVGFMVAFRTPDTEKNIARILRSTLAPLQLSEGDKHYLFVTLKRNLPYLMSRPALLREVVGLYRSRTGVSATEFLRDLLSH